MLVAKRPMIVDGDITLILLSCMSYPYYHPPLHKLFLVVGLVRETLHKKSQKDHKILFTYKSSNFKLALTIFSRNSLTEKLSPTIINAAKQ